MKAENGYYRWKKGDKTKINDYFVTSEFSCQCKHVDCVDQKISEDLIQRLSSLREAKNTPITITSGFRCHKHQEDIRNSGTSTVVAKLSQHELGNAADVKFNSLTSVEAWLEDAKKLFSYIGIARTFLHVDTRNAKAGTHVTWKY